MSGRSGYRKTERKRTRSMLPPPRREYVLRCQLPFSLAFALAPGEHGYGITIGYNDVMFVAGQNPSHCCQLAADFLDKIGARRFPQEISAAIVKLLPCPAHLLPISRNQGFNKIAIDLEAVHDRISRNADRARAVRIDIASDAIAFSGGIGRRIIHDYADTRRRA